MTSKRVNITESVEIANTRVKPFSGQRRYLATGDLAGDEISGIASVDYETKPSRADLLVNEGDIIVARMQATNKVLLIDKTNKDLIVSTGFLTLKPQNGFDHTYLTHFLRSEIFQRQKDQYCSGATQKAINNGAFEKLSIPIYLLVEQKKIAEVLDCADTLRQKRKQSLQLLDKFLDAAFLDMFGDVSSGKTKWAKKNLVDVSEVVSGVTKGRKFGHQKTVTVPYMRVANVQDGYINIKDLKYIEVLPEDVEKFRLRQGDVLLTEGGDPDKLGRGAVWTCEIENCIHQNHIFRVRVNSSDEIIPIFLSALIGSAYGKKYFLRAAKQTTGIATINSTQLKKFPVILPPIELQRKYAQIYNRVEELKEKAIKSGAELDNQFNALTQKYFS